MTSRSRGALLLTALGHTQVRLSTRLGVSTGIVAMWQSGQRTPGLPNRKLLQEKYQIPIESWDEVPEPVATKPATQQAPGWGENTVNSRVDRLQRIVDKQLAELEAEAELKPEARIMTPLGRARVMADLSRTIGQIRKMKGEEVSEIKVLRHPKWIEIRDIVFNELRDDPKRLKRIVEKLENAEPRGA